MRNRIKLSYDLNNELFFDDKDKSLLLFSRIESAPEDMQAPHKWDKSCRACEDK